MPGWDDIPDEKLNKGWDTIPATKQETQKSYTALESATEFAKKSLTGQPIINTLATLFDPQTYKGLFEIASNLSPYEMVETPEGPTFKKSEAPRQIVGALYQDLKDKFGVS